jgi:hypothetical protein
MADNTVKLTIYGLTVEEAQSIFFDAVEACERNLDADMFVEIRRRELPKIPNSLPLKWCPYMHSHIRHDWRDSEGVAFNCSGRLLSENA